MAAFATAWPLNLPGIIEHRIRELPRKATILKNLLRDVVSCPNLKASINFTFRQNCYCRRCASEVVISTYKKLSLNPKKIKCISTNLEIKDLHGYPKCALGPEHGP